jgi:hypothetical protein
LAAKGVLLFTLTILVALFLFEALLLLILIYPLAILFRTPSLLILILVNALTVLFPSLTSSALVSPSLTLLNRNVHSNFARRQCLYAWGAPGFALSLLFGAGGGSLLLFSLSLGALRVGLGSALSALGLAGLLLFLILLRTCRTTRFTLGLSL